MTVEPKIIFIERKYPSANMVLVKDKEPLLFDSGFGSDCDETESIIQQYITPENLHTIANTHYHSDHVGGNHLFQKKYQTKIAAHIWDKDLINQKQPDACAAQWLKQPVDKYYIDRGLDDLDELSTGVYTFQTLHTPGHTMSHLSFYEPTEKLLILGDLLHKDDIGWLNIYREGIHALNQSINSIERLRQLPVNLAYSGHGKAIDHPSQAMDNAVQRLERWAKEPKKYAWHACKRIFAFALMIRDGLSKAEIKPYLLACPWFHDYAQYAFQLQANEFIQPLINEMLRSKAAAWQNDKLIATAPFNTPSHSWMNQDIMPMDW